MPLCASLTHGVEGLRDCPGDDDGDEGVGRALEGAAAEDAAVEEEEGQFCEAAGDRGKPVDQPKLLRIRQLCLLALVVE